jgi:putative ABC transport system ATP-binding protein
MESSPEEVLVRARGVAKGYTEGERRHTVLRGLDLELRRGEIVVLLGRSGSGKSSLLNLLAGLDVPDSGQVEVAGTPLSALDERARTVWRRRHLGFVFQFFNLIPTLSVLENVLLHLELGRVPRDEARSRARAMLERVGLAGREDSSPERLSGGEQQRVAIAAAMVHEPDLVLADEPTGNLDLGTGRAVIELLDELTRQRGGTLFMATHSLEVMGVADRVLRLEDGVLTPVRDGAVS